MYYVTRCRRGSGWSSGRKQCGRSKQLAKNRRFSQRQSRCSGRQRGRGWVHGPSQHAQKRREICHQWRDQRTNCWARSTFFISAQPHIDWFNCMVGMRVPKFGWLHRTWWDQTPHSRIVPARTNCKGARAVFAEGSCGEDRAGSINCFFICLFTGADIFTLFLCFQLTMRALCMIFNFIAMTCMFDVAYNAQF